MMIKATKIFILFLVLSVSLNAQFHDYGVKLGLSYSQIFPSTEFYESSAYKASYQFRGLMRFEIVNPLDVELSAGYGTLAGLDFDMHYWQSKYIPFDLKFLINPFKISFINPYIFTGVGGMNFWTAKFPSTVSLGPVKDKGWTAYIPSGLGAEFKINKFMTVDVNLGYTYTFSDDLNYFTYSGDSPNDGYFHASIGFSFYNLTSAKDTDGDGLTDEYELSVGLFPDVRDSDNDGISDGDEVLVYHTSPFSVDSDQDGLTDYEEIIIYKSKPNVADSDNDGILDGSEVMEYGTDPMKYDTDGDGLSDREEIVLYKTDPLKADSDGDGLTDYEEVMVHKTNPLMIDTDGGLADDLTEIENGTDPNYPDDDIVIIGVPLVLNGVSFLGGSGEIAPSSISKLEEVLNLFRSYPGYNFEIRAYTDNIGDVQYNLDLTQRQAEAIMQWFVNRGVDRDRLRAIGYGSANPRASNDTLEGRFSNRRIELVRID